ncbi:hypothetical protein [Antarctobacter jejuensis]|uniref:hypothetical protein n=1 Tax=Antarctobacter jejuensis TaxID=1439938 RepID=UPI003FD17357
MFILEGVGALLAGLVLYLWAEALHHRETAPGWARRQIFVSAVGLVLVALVPAGAGLFTYGLEQPMTAASWIGLAGLAFVPVVLWAGRRG